MPKQLARYAVVAAMGTLLGGCLYETTLDANGGGVMSIVLRGTSRKGLEGIKNKMQNSAVKVLSAEFSGRDDNGEALFKLQFEDLTKLPTAEFFRNVSIKRSDGVEGSQVLTAIVRNARPGDLSDAQIERLGRDVKVVVTFPGDVIESNGTASAPNAVTWTWGMKEFFRASEVMMTAAYKPSAAAATAPTAASSAAVTPAT
jgi:LppM domain